MWRKFVKDYLTFSKKDRIAVYILIVIIVILAVAPFFIPEKKLDPLTEEDLAFVEEVKGQFVVSDEDDDGISQDTYAERERNATLSANYFYFDPNTISTNQWKQLGVSSKTASTIGKYLAKGGRFKEPEDLLKIYTLDQKLAHALIPYVRIEKPKVAYSQETIADSQKEKVEYKSSFPKKEYHSININLADTLALMMLPGIGSFRARMIVRLRDSLFGFRSVDQLAGQWFLPDSVYQKLAPYLIPGEYQYPPLNINTVALEDLEKHPLFGSSIARVIIAYRSQHGAFTQLSDLLKIHVIDENLYNKMKSFVVVR